MYSFLMTVHVYVWKTDINFRLIADHKERSFLYFELEDRLYGITPYYFAKVIL